jgi:hypothetical protein
MNRKKKVKRRTGFLQVMFVLFWAGFLTSVSQASFIYSLKIFTGNGNYHNSPDLNFSVEAAEGGAGQVDFTFRNESGIDSCIASIYFDDGSLKEIAQITNGSGTSFSQPATPHNLPAGNTLSPSFVTTDGLAVAADPSPAHNGINRGEWVKVTFNLMDGKTYNDIIYELKRGIDEPWSGGMRIGEHIIAFPDGSSESAVNIPEPMTIMLAGLGMGLIGRRIKHKLPARKI